MINEILENKFIQKLTAQFHRSPMQLNKLHESDAEIVHLFPGPDTCLAVTTDSVAEEISVGLYNDPYLAGWMAVMVNMSDLAAVGAQPIGILVSEVLPKNFSPSAIARLQSGIHDACLACDTHVLGGDTNIGEQMVLTGSGLGIINGNRFLSRIGCQAGDSLYATNVLGIGNAFALAHFLNLEKLIGKRVTYQPHARLREGQILRGFATACMDTSDGVISTLDQLMRLNNVGFELDADWQSLLCPEARELADKMELPSWLMLAGQHGEFELLFTVPQNHEESFLQHAAENSWQPLRLGKVIDEPAINLPLHSDMITLDTGRIRNLSHQVDGNVEVYISELLKLDEEIQKGVLHHGR